MPQNRNLYWKGVKDRLPRGSKAKLLFSNITQFIPANCEPNNIDVLLVDEAHRISSSANNQYTPTDKRTNLTQIQTIVKQPRYPLFFIRRQNKPSGVEIGSSQLIQEMYQGNTMPILSEVELKYPSSAAMVRTTIWTWLEQVIYNEP